MPAIHTAAKKRKKQEINLTDAGKKFSYDVFFIILDFSFDNKTIIHPFSLVNNLTREVWLNHPLSLPYRLSIELQTIEKFNLKNEYFQFKYYSSLISIVNKKLKLIEEKIERRKNGEQLIGRIEELIDDDEFDEDILPEAERLIVEYIKDIKLTEMGASFTFCGFSFSAGTSALSPFFLPTQPNWEEIKTQCETNLTINELKDFVGALTDFAGYDLTNNNNSDEEIF
ncbi:hypothetical protein ABK040_014352 [Willaertia magna]